jgi:hypothetical protein
VTAAAVAAVAAVAAAAVAAVAQAEVAAQEVVLVAQEAGMVPVPAASVMVRVTAWDRLTVKRTPRLVWMPAKAMGRRRRLQPLRRKPLG